MEGLAISAVPFTAEQSSRRTKCLVISDDDLHQMYDLNGADKSAADSASSFCNGGVIARNSHAATYKVYMHRSMKACKLEQ